MTQGILASPSIRVASRDVSLCVDRAPELVTEITAKPAEEGDSDSPRVIVRKGKKGKVTRQVEFAPELMVGEKPGPYIFD